MCYYNGCKVTRAEFIRLMGIEKEIRNLQLNKPLQSGFDYRDWPIIKPSADGKDWNIKMVHWEYIPSFVHDEVELKQSRLMIPWLNAKGENLFVNEKGKMSMWREGALTGRCLALSTGFFEFRHLPKIGKRGLPVKATEAFPYFITVRDNPDEIFFMAGISREWENVSRGKSADTFAIVTTSANELMEKVHNLKRRMPVILPGELAEEWISPGLTKERIMEIASYQYPAEKMMAYPVKNFLAEMPEDPLAEYHDQKLLPL